jgi:hypothetical protein
VVNFRLTGEGLPNPLVLFIFGKGNNY